MISSYRKISAIGMSRSYRKTPIIAMTTSSSEKKDKRLANRALRLAIRLAIESELESMPELKEVSNPWCFAKDGRRFFDKDKYPHLMRK